MMTTRYLDNKTRTDLTESVQVDYVKEAENGKIKFSRILGLLLMMMTDESEEGRAAFNAVMVQFAMYMQCEGVLSLLASPAWYDIIATANTELLAMLDPSNKEYDELN